MFFLLSLIVTSDVSAQQYPPALAVPRGVPAWTRALNIDSATPAVVHLQCADANTWALTYDDGPSAVTPGVLQELAALNVKGTFFVTGNSIMQYRDTLRQIYAAGHEIALHSWSHTSFNTLTDDQIVSEMHWNVKIIKDTIGVSPVLFRPPLGEANSRVLRVLGALGLRVVLWNRDTNDWIFSFPTTVPTAPYNATDTPEAITRLMGQWANTVPRIGTISLQHDVFERPARQIGPSARIVSQSPYRLATVSQCIGSPAYNERFLEQFDEQQWLVPPATTTEANPEGNPTSTTKATSTPTTTFGIRVSSAGNRKMETIVGVLAAFWFLFF